MFAIPTPFTARTPKKGTSTNKSASAGESEEEEESEEEDEDEQSEKEIAFWRSLATKFLTCAKSRQYC